LPFLIKNQEIIYIIKIVVDSEHFTKIKKHYNIYYLNYKYVTVSFKTCAKLNGLKTAVVSQEKGE